MTYLLVLLLFLSLTMSGCERAKEETDNDAWPLSVQAGPDQTAHPGATVILSGTARDPGGATLGYLWQQTGGPFVSLTGGNTLNATFTAPDGSVEQTLTFQFTAASDLGTSASDQTRVTVLAKTPESDIELPVRINEPPFVRPQGNLSLLETGDLESVLLEFYDRDGDIVDMQVESSDESVATVSSHLSISEPRWIAVFPVKAGKTTITVMVWDDEGASATMSFDVTVMGVPKPPIIENQPPVIQPMRDITLTLGEPLNSTPIRLRDPDYPIVAPCSLSRLNSESRLLSGPDCQDRDGLSLDDDDWFTIHDEGGLAINGAIVAHPEGVVAFSMGSVKVVEGWLEIDWERMAMGPGTTKITVTVRDDRGASATQTFRVTVKDLARETFETIGYECTDEDDRAARYASLAALWDGTPFVVDVSATFPNAEELMEVVEIEAEKIDHALGYSVFRAGEIVDLPDWNFEAISPAPDGHIEIQCCIPDGFVHPGYSHLGPNVPGIASLWQRAIGLVRNDPEDAYHQFDMLEPLTVSAHVLTHELWHILGFHHPDEDGVTMSQNLMFWTGRPDIEDMAKLACVYD